jgi:hypothetical protein
MIKTDQDRRKALLLHYSKHNDNEKAVIASLNGIEALDDFSVLGEEHPLFRESIAIIDAFEGAVNGMLPADTLYSRPFSEGSPLLRNWRLLIRAIALLYQGCPQQAAALCGEMDEEAPQKKLTPVFTALASGTPPAGDAESRLYEALTEESFYVKSMTLALEDAAENSDSDIFFSTLRLYVNELAQTDTDAAKALTAWAFRLSLEKDWPETEAADLFTQLCDKTERLRLLALLALNYDSPFSLQAYLNYLLFYFEEPRSTQEVKAVLKILGEIALITEKNSGDEEEFNALWRSVQLTFYRNYEAYHLLWPQEESLWQEAALLYYGRSMRAAPENHDEKIIKNKQPELF